MASWPKASTTVLSHLASRSLDHIRATPTHTALCHVGLSSEDTSCDTGREEHLHLCWSSKVCKLRTGSRFTFPSSPKLVTGKHSSKLKFVTMILSNSLNIYLCSPICDVIIADADRVGLGDNFCWSTSTDSAIRDSLVACKSPLSPYYTVFFESTNEHDRRRRVRRLCRLPEDYEERQCYHQVVQHTKHVQKLRSSLPSRCSIAKLYRSVRYFTLLWLQWQRFHGRLSSPVRRVPAWKCV